MGAAPDGDAGGVDAAGGRALTAAELAALAAGARAQPFETEVSRLMDIIVHSLYTRREVFLRELVSNGVDALDRQRFLALTNASARAPPRELHVLVRADRAAHTLHIRDTGVGMTAAELARNLGTIARSGTVDFIRRTQAQQQEQQQHHNNNKKHRDELSSLIGQFGVGFYSAFLVADRVAVVSKSADDPVQHVWQSTAAGSFTVAPDPRGNTLGRGTEVVLHLRDDSLEWLDPARLRTAIRRYAQFVTFPVKLLVPHEREEAVPAAPAHTSANSGTTGRAPAHETERQRRLREEMLRDDVFGGEEEEELPSDEDEQEEQEQEQEQQKKKTETRKVVVWEWEVLNSLAPIWTRSPQRVAAAEYVEFYKVLAHTHHAPLAWTHFAVEGAASFRALLYIPHELRLDVWAPQGATTAAPGSAAAATAPPPGVRLYVRHVLVTDQQVGALLPPWLRFLVGVVDSDDAPVTVGREAVLDARVVAAVQRTLVRKALALMAQLHAADPALTGNYSRFHRRFASALKLGAADDRAHRAALLDLLLFDSTHTLRAQQQQQQQQQHPSAPSDYSDNDDEPEQEPAKTTLRAYVERLRARSRAQAHDGPHTGDVQQQQRRQQREAHQILYLAGASLDDLQRSPLLERAAGVDGREVLLLTDPMDEYLVAAVRTYELPPESPSDSSSGNNDDDDSNNDDNNSESNDHDDSDKDNKATKKENKPERYTFVDLSRNENELEGATGDARWARRVEPLAEWMRGAIGVPQLERVVASTKLARSPAAVTAGDQGLTSNMERLVRAQAVRPPAQQAALDAARRAPTRVLELNARHPLVRAMTERHNSGRADATLRRAAKLLYHTALAASGYADDEPQDLADTAYALLEELLGVSPGSSSNSVTTDNNKEEL